MSSSNEWGMVNIRVKSKGVNGRVKHIVGVGNRKALCGDSPGDKSLGWLPAGDSSFPLGQVTCLRCIKRYTEMYNKILWG